MVTNPQDHPRFQAVSVGRTPSVTALALRDVVVAFCPMEDFSTTSSSATQLLLFKVGVNGRNSRLVVALDHPVIEATGRHVLRSHDPRQPAEQGDGGGQQQRIENVEDSAQTRQPAAGVFPLHVPLNQ